MTKKLFVLAIASCIGITAIAQKKFKDTLTANQSLDDLIVYANKFEENYKRVAQTIKVIKQKSTLQLQPNVGDVLINSGAVFVQKSQQGGGSPVIRGFEASRVLLMVDGIRMNNAIYRSGHLQNIITVDNTILDRIEVIYGPSSTLYGSDALGGVVNLYTQKPVLNPSKKWKTTSNMLTRYSTAIEEAKIHADVNIANQQWAYLTSITYSSFGHIRQGSNRRSAYPNFGLQPYIVQRINGIDSAVANANPNLQKPSGYNQIDLVQKVLYQPSAGIQHSLNIQHSNSTNIPRYDRLTEKNGNNPAWAEWYYGPQMRSLIAYQFNAQQLAGFFQQVSATVNFQDVEESRIQRRFRSNNRDHRIERVNVFGATIDAKHYHAKNELHVGIESYTNYVQSRAYRFNINSGVRSKINTRYPDGFNKMSWNAVYAQHTYKINQHFTLTDGLRLNAVKSYSSFIDTALFKFPYTEAKQNHLALTGNIGLVYANENNLRTALSLSSGFRSPNIDDLGKVFDSQVGRIIVPNNNIQPEYTYNVEWNITKTKSSFTYGASLFYTWFKNAIVTDRFQYNGQDSILYNGVMSLVLANQNKASAKIYGFSINAGYELSPATLVSGIVTYTYGRYKNNQQQVPLDHVPPVYGKFSITHQLSNFNVQAFMLFNGWKRIDQYNPFGEDNLQYATPDGMPGWKTLNLSIQYQYQQKLLLQLNAENLLDVNYRYFASGISAPGRNFILSAKLSF